MSTVGERLERIPFGRFHIGLLLIGGTGYAFDGLDSAIIAFVLPVLGHLWSLDAVHVGMIGSATYVGFFWGAMFAGLVGDRIGRRPVMMWALALFCFASLVSAVMVDFGSFIICRIAAGIGTGAESAIVAPFLAEFAATRYRGAFSSVLAGFFSLGFLGAAALGYLLVPVQPYGWRLALALTAAPVVLLLWWRRVLPESPRWLESVGRSGESALILDHIEARARASGHDIPFTPLNKVSVDRVKQAKPSLSEQFMGLWAPAQRRATAVSWAVWLSITFAYYAIFTWIPSLLMARGMTMSHSFAFSIAIYAAQLPGYLSAAAAVEFLGRRATISLYLAASAVGAFALGEAGSTSMLLVEAVILAFCLSGAYSGVYAYTPELFPTRLRATGNGTASAVGRIGAIISPTLVGWLIPRTGFLGVLVLISAALFFGMITVVLFGPRTEGRSLESIDTKQAGRADDDADSALELRSPS